MDYFVNFYEMDMQKDPREIRVENTSLTWNIIET